MMQRFPWVALILLMLGCNGDDADGNEGVQLLPAGSVKFSLDDSTVITDPTMVWNSYYDLESFFSAAKNEFLFFKREGGTLVRRVALSVEGPNGTGRIEDFAYSYAFLSADTVLLLNSLRQELLVLDLAGKAVVKRIRLANVLPEGYRFDINPGQELQIDKCNIFLNTMPGSYDVMSDKNSLASDLICRFNFADSSIIFFGSFPALYSNGVWFDYFSKVFFCTTSDGQIVASFPAVDSIYCYNHSGKLEKRNAVEYDDFEEVEPPGQQVLQGNLQFALENFVTQRRLGCIFVDKYHGNRIVQLVSAKKSKEEFSMAVHGVNGSIPNPLSHPPVLLSFNAKGERIGQQTMPDQAQRIDFAYFRNDALLMHTSSSNENEIIFKRFVWSDIGLVKL